jgi:outer membrane usher protein
MNNHFHSYSRALNAELLSLSQASVAVLLAFTAGHAKADDTAAASIAVQPGAASPAGAQSSEIEGQAMSNKADVAPAPPIPLTLSPPAAGPGGTGAGSTNAPQPAPAQPKEVQFNSQFLSGSGVQSLDISRFNKGNVAAAGQYRVALYVNQVWIGVTDITLRDLAGPDHPAQPVFNRDLLTRMGIDIARLSDVAREKLDGADTGQAVLLPELIPQSTATFDMGEQRLDVTVPQAMMNRSARGWVDPKYWDDGINAALVQYNANVYHSSGGGISNTQSYLGLNTGINVGAWRFR